MAYTKPTVAYTMPQQRKKEENERLRGEGNKLKFIDLRFERGQMVASGKATRQDIPAIARSWDEW